jgi:hypothetical protein
VLSKRSKIGGPQGNDETYRVKIEKQKHALTKIQKIMEKAMHEHA